MVSKSIDDVKKEEWYIDLSNDGQYIFDLIYKYHQYFSYQDKKYRYIVRILRLLLLLLTMISTIVLGMNSIIQKDCQILIGLVISALITFITAILAYFNYEEYWMRNITIHIDLNILRDRFVFDAKAGNLNGKEKILEYQNFLEELQKKNIEYWTKSLKKIG